MFAAASRQARLPTDYDMPRVTDATAAHHLPPASDVSPDDANERRLAGIGAAV